MPPTTDIKQAAYLFFGSGLLFLYQLFEVGNSYANSGKQNRCLFITSAYVKKCNSPIAQTVANFQRRTLTGPSFFVLRWKRRIGQDAKCHSIAPKTGLLGPGAEPEEDHADEDEGQIDGLGAQVALAEQQGPAEERHHDRTAADHRDDGDHRLRIAQGIEVGEVGH